MAEQLSMIHVLHALETEYRPSGKKYVLTAAQWADLADQYRRIYRKPPPDEFREQFIISEEPHE